VAPIFVQRLELIVGCLVIVAVRQPTNHNHESCIWQLWDITSRIVAHTLSQIHYRSYVASVDLLPRLPNLAYTYLRKHLNPLSPNPFGILIIFHRQACLKCHQKICNRRLPVQGSISQLFQTVLSPDNGLMLLLQKPNHLHFLPLVEGTKLGCPILLANCFKENSVCFMLIGALPSAPPKSDASSLSYAALYL